MISFVSCLLLVTMLLFLSLNHALRPGRAFGARGLSRVAKSTAPSVKSTSASSSLVDSEAPKAVYNVVSFYKFFKLSDEEIAHILASLKRSLGQANMRGTLLIAREGINAQFALQPHELSLFHSILNETHSALFGNIAFNVHEPPLSMSPHENAFPFQKLFLKKKKEILTTAPMRDEFGQPLPSKVVAVDWEDAGPELSPAQWHEEVKRAQSNNTLILDCRNDYETRAGRFVHAIPLNTRKFSESFDKLEEIVSSLSPTTRLLTYCTGGIRCVKVNSYLKERGFQNIARLERGIVHYENWARREGMERVEEIGEMEERGEEGVKEGGEEREKSLFIGRNFLFDRRRLGEEGEEREE